MLNVCKSSGYASVQINVYLSKVTMVHSKANKISFALVQLFSDYRTPVSSKGNIQGEAPCISVSWHTNV